MMSGGGGSASRHVAGLFSVADSHSPSCFTIGFLVCVHPLIKE
jgi:hypothetical protein